MKIEDHLEYTITHPLTKKEVVWTGERIKRFSSTYGVKIEVPQEEEKPKAKPKAKPAPKPKAKKKTTRASKKDAPEPKSESEE